MADPIQRTTFSNLLRANEVTFTLSENTGDDVTGGGGAIRVESGTRLWMGEISVVRESRAEAQIIDAALARLTAAGGSFILNHPYTTPLMDQDRTGLAGFSPRLKTVEDGGASVVLNGLPVGYVLTAGDMVTWSHGSPISRGLHRILDTVVADGLGEAAFDIMPHTTSPTNRAVVLYDPFIKAIVVPESYQDPNYRAGLRGERKFKFRQVLQ